MLYLMERQNIWTYHLKKQKTKEHFMPNRSRLWIWSDQEIKTQIPHFWARALKPRDCSQFTFTFPLPGIN